MPVQIQKKPKYITPERFVQIDSVLARSPAMMTTYSAAQEVLGVGKELREQVETLSRLLAASNELLGQTQVERDAMLAHKKINAAKLQELVEKDEASAAELEQLKIEVEEQRVAIEQHRLAIEAVKSE